ncbi:MAG TPA: hypothetical protein VFI33_06995 [Puia sp.]|nr:hypothetical protein [Puia sp.]
MREEKNNKKYTSEYIRKYLDGELSDQDMQALEKDALEDPFLADAIEGFEESRKHAVSFETGIADLKTKLSERISQRNSRRGLLFQLTKWPVAASFLLVIGLAVFMVIYVNKNPDISQTEARPDSAAVTLTKPSQENPAKSDSIKSDEQAIASVRSGKGENKNAKKDEQAIASVRSGKGENKNAIKDEQAIASVRSGKEERTADRKDKSSDKEEDKSLPNTTADNLSRAKQSVTKTDTIYETEKSEAFAKKEMVAPSAAAKQRVSDGRLQEVVSHPAAEPAGNYIKGVVINDMGKPVPFAKVNLKGSDKHVFTDTSGFFKLYMKNPRLAALVYLQPPGYQSASAELLPDSNITNTIQLHASTSESDANMSLNEKISPFVIGWDAFYHFIDSNKKINSKDSLMKGEEVISFTLYSDGRLSPLRIEESVSPAHDREILRLIPLAPPLTLREKKRIRCVLHIEFK